MNIDIVFLMYTWFGSSMTRTGSSEETVMVVVLLEWRWIAVCMKQQQF